MKDPKTRITTVPRFLCEPQWFGSAKSVSFHPYWIAPTEDNKLPLLSPGIDNEVNKMSERATISAQIVSHEIEHSPHPYHWMQSQHVITTIRQLQQMSNRLYQSS